MQNTSRGVLASASVLFSLLIGLPAFAGEVTIDNGGVTRHVASIRELRFAHVIRQQFDFSCGSAAIANLLTYGYERTVSERDVFSLMWAKGDQASIQKVGFSLLDMQTYLAAIGLNSDGYKVDFDQIVTVGVPAITLITTKGYNHFVVVRGVRDGQVLIADPALGLRKLAKEDFLKIWSGILFVITDAAPIARAHFNAEEDWALVPIGPVARGMDQQRLGLTASYLNLPLRNEF
jgi:predicted double-glycine peptidase